MNQNTEGVWLRSEGYTYSAGNSFSVKKDFLSQAQLMSAPEIDQIIIEITGTMSGVTGGALGVDGAKLLSNVLFKDDAEIINCSGANLRLVEQLEYGGRQIDPADVNSGSTSTTYRMQLRLGFGVPKSLRPRDTRIELERWLATGELTLSTPASSPTGMTVGACTIRVFAYVIDGRDRELKSRMTIREIAVTNTDYEYDVNGSCRFAILTSLLTTTSYSSWASFTTVFSRTKALPPSFPTAFLVDKYRTDSLNLSTADAFTAATPLAIPFVSPALRQKIGAMMDIKTLHVDLTPSATAIPTNARIVLCQIKDRPPVSAALVLGQTSPEAAARAVESYGYVQDGRTGGSKVTSYLPSLARRLPIRLRPGA